MSQTIISEFIKNAQERGLSKDQIDSFLKTQFNIKSAEDQVDSIITNILTDAGVEKNAQSIAYVEGVLKSAVDNGCSDEQAVEAAKYIVGSNEKLAKVTTKKASQSQLDQVKIATYAEGFMKRAQEYGFSEGQSLDMCKLALNQLQPPVEKKAHMGGGGGGGELQQLLAMLQSPEALGGGAGALAGGLGGAAMSDPAKKGGHPGRNAMLGALAGGGLGAGVGTAMPGGHENPEIMQLIHQLLGQGGGDAGGQGGQPPMPPQMPPQGAGR